ncbi:hypothetical protein Syun_006969 [Stephania yunnanensis]|uniref:Uncharacterized protein n=1 Tax=Stephania yunnanensis TaxID=152371 RepID=A0AAP0PY61_9MAGN
MVFSSLARSLVPPLLSSLLQNPLSVADMYASTMPSSSTVALCDSSTHRGLH